jgi:ABC-2 type transport system ATP-binding protein
LRVGVRDSGQQRASLNRPRHNDAKRTFAIGLDPRGIRTMKDSIRERVSAGAGVMLSSHLLALVEDLCDALLIMHKGQRMFFGTIAQARAQFAAQGDASLEDLFFRVTEGAPAQPEAAPAPAPSTTP